MSSTYAEPFARLDECLDEIAAIDPTYRTTGEKQDGLVALTRFIARAQSEQLRILATADDVAEETGDRSAAAWMSRVTRDAHSTVRRNAVLAAALDTRWRMVAEGFAGGDLNLAQTRVIADALDALPKDLADDLLVKAEAHLVSEAAHHGPRELRLLGAKILSVVAPDVADEAEYQALLTAERHASATTRLTTRRRGDGSTDIHARVPDHAAGRLGAYLNAFTAPRRRHRWRPGETADTPFGPLTPAGRGETDEFADLPVVRQRGEAFVALLENVSIKLLPRHGGNATTVGVTIPYDELVDEASTFVADTTTGERVTAGVLRRWACQAGIYPVVLDGASEILDVGRTRRLVTAGIRKALNLRDQGCTETGCTMPAEFCEAHHQVPWSRGGKTSLRDCKLLCPFHHHRAHDPGWITHHDPNGKTSFTRRQ